MYMYIIECTYMCMLLTCGRDEFPCDPCFGFTLDVRELFDTCKDPDCVLLELFCDIIK